LVHGKRRSIYLLPGGDVDEQKFDTGWVWV